MDQLNMFTRHGATRALAALLALAVAAIACGSESDTTAETVPETAIATAAPAEPTSAPALDDASQDTAEPAVIATASELPIDWFIPGALASEIVTVDCELADGTASVCYSITVAGFPADGDVGPFCPTTTSDTAEQVGIWFDGEAVYDIDGQFILDLPEIYNDDNWQLYESDGSVRVTDTPEGFDAAARPNVAVEYQNHCVEGQIAWLDNGEPVTSTVLIPVRPTPGDSITTAGNSLGVTFNGVIIAGAAPVDAILGAYTIAAFDDCGGHINPVDGYHLHGATGCSEVGEAVDGETPAFALAMDGYVIHSPLDDETAAAAGLDECYGHTTDELGYHYHAHSPEQNAVLSCYTGKTTADAVGRQRPGG